MKAVLLHEYGPAKNLRWEDAPDPQPGEGEVLVRVHAAGINPIDWKVRSGAMKEFMPQEFPTILGYDFSGTVQALGDKVTGLKVGDRVFGLSSHTYAELVVANAAAIAIVPGEAGGKPALEMTTAGAVPLASTTGSQIMLEGAEAKAGETVVLTGATGSVGRVALYAAKEAGVKVIALVRAKNIDEALKLGADAAIDSSDDAELAKLGTVDAVADLVGGPLAVKLLSKVKPGGIFASAVGAPAEAKLHPTIVAKSFQQHPDPKAFVHYGEAVRDGKLVLPIDRVMSMSEAAEAQAAGEKGGLGKIVLTA
ncbi:NADPH:quinone reductase [Bryocella elongata]|uniref:NADPH:quinone reductase n=1 Tax=Bryocella elongata TaxID=863522 RepID=A0A1H5Y2Q2_9BACT|nr:NADP-dependent oxidoreductase [Bryocella elongata]SEG18284.1 NADPH:quinone reductase [Bryocella elongata]